MTDAEKKLAEIEERLKLFDFDAIVQVLNVGYRPILEQNGVVMDPVATYIKGLLTYVVNGK